MQLQQLLIMEMHCLDANFAELCNKYKTALQDQILSCGDAGGVLQSIIDSLGDCSEDNCEEAKAATDAAINAYTNATDSDYSNLCNAYKIALENQISQ